MNEAVPPPLPPTPPPQLQPTMGAEKKTHWFWRLFFWMVLFGSISLNLLLILAWLAGESPVGPYKHTVYSEKYSHGDQGAKDKIAIIRLEGIITSDMGGNTGLDGMVGDIREQFELATADDRVKAIILYVDSPGGEVLASDQIYRIVKKVRDEGNKPVICYMNRVAASGGYYAAMGTDWIVADELTITGSIGVIMSTLNYKDLFGKVGLKSLVFKSGAFKDILNGSREPTQEEMTLVQDLVAETYERFLDVVATERKLEKDTLREGIADGRIFSGKQALTHKLVDQNGTLKDAINKAQKEAGLTKVQVIEYEVPFNFGQLFGAFAESRVKPAQIQLNIETPLAMKLKPGQLYYLSLHMF